MEKIRQTALTSIMAEDCHICFENFNSMAESVGGKDKHGHHPGVGKSFYILSRRDVNCSERIYIS